MGAPRAVPECYPRARSMLSLREYVMQESLPLATVHEAILDYCRDRQDVCVFGAQASSLYAGVPRMTQDVDLMADAPEAVAHELAARLARRFPHRMAACVRTVRRGERVLGYRVCQQRSDEQGGSRDLADVRVLDVPRAALSVENGVQYTGPRLTLAMKVMAATLRSNALKRDQDRIDARQLMLALRDVSAADLEPLWLALGAPSTVRRAFEELGADLESNRETDADDFY